VCGNCAVNRNSVGCSCWHDQSWTSCNICVSPTAAEVSWRRPWAIPLFRCKYQCQAAWFRSCFVHTNNGTFTRHSPVPCHVGHERLPFLSMDMGRDKQVSCCVFAAKARSYRTSPYLVDYSSYDSHVFLLCSANGFVHSVVP
jgi:hypothetical protein